MRHVTTSIVLLLAACLGPARAEVHKGMLEFDTNFWFEISESESRSGSSPTRHGRAWTGLISGHTGYFVTDRIDAGGAIAFSYADFDGGSGNSRAYSIGPAINWHFRTKRRIVPLVGLFTRWRWQESNSVFGDREEDGWEIEGAGGADFFANEHVAFRARAVWNHFERESDSSGFSSEVDVDDYRIEVGVAVFLDLSRDRR